MECWAEVFGRRERLSFIAMRRMAARLWPRVYPTPSETLCLITNGTEDG